MKTFLIIFVVFVVLLVIITVIDIIALKISYYDFKDVCEYKCKEWFNSTYSDFFGISWRFQGKWFFKKHWYGCNGCICSNGERIPVQCYD